MLTHAFLSSPPAHIDHGKTTLMDRLLAATGHATGEERAMDSNTLEKERGITILAKVTHFELVGLKMLLERNSVLKERRS